MLTRQIIAQAIDNQRKELENTSLGIQREVFDLLPQVDNFATIVTGLRRCGKSTLLLQKIRQNPENVLFLNFDDIRLSDFGTSDFSRLHLEIQERGVKSIFLDEIQVIDKWEIFVHQLLRENYKVFITGSNATLLSVELSTHLTGRNLSFELFPFSYNEFLRFKNLSPDENSAAEYLLKGGMPEYLKTNQSLVLSQLVDDILLKDIAVRYGVKDVSSLRQMAVYLLSNVGNYLSANKLRGMFNIKSVSSLTDYLSFMENVYLFYFIPVFDYSLRVQQRNPRKIYCVDSGMVSVISQSFSTDYGHRLENLVFMHLRRKTKRIYYYKGRGECDFVAFFNQGRKTLTQVCAELTDFNLDREVNGMFEALDDLSETQGTIVTINQTDEFTKNNKTIKVIPLYKFLTYSTEL
ncbi:MAG: ATP-binding protein [Bacteroidales bacterium]|nr:ATP-binding protein [Bacteroidales bacterium]